ncbi:MAG: HAD family hydrolase [Elusimicrobia bacterium]|nr:HAD family hydrolase [Elusimicrobiota bacterium]
MPPQTTVLLFDYGGTLDDDGRPWLERFSPLWREAGADGEAVARAFYDADDGLPGRHDLRGKGLAETVLLQCRRVAELLLPSDPGAAQRVADRFVEESRRTLRRNRPVLERLAARYRLGVVSNFYGNLEDVLASEGLRDLFGAVADSQRVGCTKPDPRLFRWALDRLGAEPGQALMVGDSLRRDMAGAEALGMPHAWMAGASQGRPCCPAAAVLRGLGDLEPLLLGTEARR